mmetsp:Transcript_28201/g.92308  ORF Transcript_28201/g.92308 Transcript_28201/m.92308 type:complete len:258 (-) Transcript_28201:3-776(-)
MDEDWAEQLNIVAGEGEVDDVRAFLEMGADPNARDPEDMRWTPLHYAVFNDRPEIVDVLLQHGAHTEPLCQGETPLHKAVWNVRILCAELLLASGANVNAIAGVEAREIQRGRTPLQCLISAPMARTPLGARCADLLIAAGADVSSAAYRTEFNTPPKTPLLMAVDEGHRQLAKIFLKAGASAKLSHWDRPLLLRDREPWKATLRLVDAVAAAGSWKLYVAEHRRVIAGVVCACARVPFPLDAAGNVVEFLFPPGGY